MNTPLAIRAARLAETSKLRAACPETVPLTGNFIPCDVCQWRFLREEGMLRPLMVGSFRVWIWLCRRCWAWSYEHLGSEA